MFLGHEVHYHMVCVAHYTELNLQICDNAQKRRICRENSKYVWPFLPYLKGCQLLPGRGKSGAKVINISYAGAMWRMGNLQTAVVDHSD